eukprot:GILI01026686.1.p1 GENE.GILI01026686.1~~GILI01026686.1.p1  ORF type:complete len:504 (+),score=133.43 GILI01026686.1:111-1622(+)
MHKTKNFFIASSVLLAISVPLLVFFSYALHNAKVGPPLDYSVVIDSGSTGSRVYVYRFPNSSLSLVSQDGASLSISPGLSTFASNLSSIGPMHLKPLLDFAASKIPADRHADTPIFLFATGGLRSLSQQQQDDVMAATRKAMNQLSPFPSSLDSVRVISGQEEAVFAWVHVNYLKGALRGEGDYVGILDQGGASSQIAFKYDQSLPSSVSSQLRLGGKDVQLYAVSHQGFGNEAAKTTAFTKVAQATPSGPLTHPCVFSGLTVNMTVQVNGTMQTLPFVGTGDYQACRNLTRDVLQLDATCSTPPCSIAGVHQPSIPSSLPFQTISWWTHLARAYNLTGDVSLTQLMNGASNLCSYSWPQAQSWLGQVADPAFSSNWPFYCWHSTFVATLGELGYRLPRTNALLNVNQQLQGSQITWTLGALLSHVPGSLDKNFFDTPRFLGLTRGVMIAFVVVCSVVAAVSLAYLLWYLRRKNSVPLLPLTNKKEQRDQLAIALTVDPDRRI